MKKPNRQQTLRRVLRRIRRFRAPLAAALVLAALSVAASLYIPVLTGQAVDAIVAAGAVNFAALKNVLLLIAAAAVVGAITQWGMSSLCTSITADVIRDLRDDAFRKLERLPLKTLDNRPYGEVVSRVISDAERLSDGLLLGFTELFSGILTIVGTLCFMLSQSVTITLVVVLLTPVSLVVAAFIARGTHGMFALQAQTRAEQTALVDEAVTHTKLSQAFCREDALTEKFDEVNARLRKHSLRAIFYSSITNPATRFVNALVYAGVGVTGALSAISGRISVGTLSCFLSYARQYTKPFNDISGVVAEMQGALACAERLFELLDEEEQPAEPKDAVVLSNAQGAIELDNVSFSYVPERPLIEGFSLSVKPGQHIALVGPTGCGKTTLINLLMRFYDVDQGAIRVDGHDIRALTRRSLRRSYGMVLQDTWRRNGAGEHRHRQIGRDGRGNHRRGEGSGRARVHPPPAAGIRHGAQERRRAFAGTEAAAVHCARDAVPAADADSRRSDELDRYAHRGKDFAGVRYADEGKDKLYRCASPVNDSECGFDSGNAGWAYCGNGYA